MTPAEFQHAVLTFYQEHGRKDLPWQKKINSYRVWVSEVMLQQTQVATVIPYFNRFMKQFPTLKSLANAHEDEVLALWSGLGYYSRARNLHKCAQLLVESYHSRWPGEVSELEKLPGIGRSTAGAILSLARNIYAPILDGNVKRVLCRFYAIDGWPGSTVINKKLWQLTETLTPVESVNHYNQAMMDLGATVCTRSKPQCERCPLTKGCMAFKQGNVTQYPTSKPKKQKPTKEQKFAVFVYNNKVLLEKRPAPGIWGGLWSLPEMKNDLKDTTHYLQWSHLNWPFNASSAESLTSFRHTFSHFHLIIQPVLFKLDTPALMVMDNNQLKWQDLDKLEELGLPAPVERLLSELESSCDQKCVL